MQLDAVQTFRMIEGHVTKILKLPGKQWQSLVTLCWSVILLTAKQRSGDQLVASAVLQPSASSTPATNYCAPA